MYKAPEEPHLVVKAKCQSRNRDPVFLELTVRNQPVSGWFSRCVLCVIGRDERPAAEQCRFTVDVCRSGWKKHMDGRWNDAPEPLVPFVYHPPNNQPTSRLKYGRRIYGVPSLAHAVDKTSLDLFPGDEKSWAGVFIKYKGDSACYGFNTGSYFHEYKNPEYEIGQGKFEVVVRFRYGSHKTSETFLLINKGTETDEFHFDLKPRKCCKRRFRCCRSG